MSRCFCGSARLSSGNGIGVRPPRTCFRLTGCEAGEVGREVDEGANCDDQAGPPLTAISCQATMPRSGGLPAARADLAPEGIGVLVTLAESSDADVRATAAANLVGGISLF